MSSYRREDKLHCIPMPEPAADFDMPPKVSSFWTIPARISICDHTSYTTHQGTP